MRRDTRDMEPEELFELLNSVGRVMSGSPDHFRALQDFSRFLVNANKNEKIEPILLSGWHREGEYHGGYEYDEGTHREILGEGVLLAEASKFINQKQGKYSATRYSTIIQAWKRVTGNRVEIIYLVIEHIYYDGTVGVDNHHGIDETWKVVNIRIVRL